MKANMDDGISLAAKRTTTTVMAGEKHQVGNVSEESHDAVMYMLRNNSSSSSSSSNKKKKKKMDMEVPILRRCSPSRLAGAMLVSVRKKHWLVASISVTGVLLLLVFNVKPPALQPARAITGEAEIGFLRRRIANDNGEATGIGAPPPPPPESHLDPPLGSSASGPKKQLPAATAASSPVHLTPEEKVAYAKQGILLVDKELTSTITERQEQEPKAVAQEEELLRKQVEQQEILKQQVKPQDQQVQPVQSGQDWQKQIKLQRAELQKQQQRLQEHHLQKQKMLQQRLQEQETNQVEPQQQQQQQQYQLQRHMVVPPPARHQSSSISVVSRTSQVSQDMTGTSTASRPSAFRRHMTIGAPAPAYPHVSYENLKNMGERFLRHTIRREFLNAPRDTDFTPGEIVNPSQIRRVIILSTWRSGSSFLGDLLRSYPGTYFSFEPLHHLLKNLHLQEGPLVEVVTNLIRSIITCDLSNQNDYVNYMRNNTFLIDHNTRLWNSCARNRALCFDKNYISNMCKYMPVNAMKTVRMGLSPVVELLQDPSLDLRIIHLVRDPRGSLYSRMQLPWCKSKACSDPETVCADLMTDLKLSSWVKERFQDRYLFVRYEDLSLMPEKKAREIMAFLDLTYQKSVAAFIKEHTSLTNRLTKRPMTYSTYRDSKATTFAWRGALNYTVMEGIQEVCKEPLQVLGLRYFQNEEEYMNMTLPVLLE